MAAPSDGKVAGALTWRLIGLMVALIICRAVDQVLYYRLAIVLGTGLLSQSLRRQQ